MLVTHSLLLVEIYVDLMTLRIDLSNRICDTCDLTGLMLIPLNHKMC